MNIAELSRVRWLLSALLVAGAALFAIGVAIEGGSEDEHQEQTKTTQEESAEAEGHEEEERVLGIDLESPVPVTLGIATSLALAVIAWRTRSRAVLLVIAAFAALFTIFDIAELIHQLDESRSGLAVYVGVVAVVHAGAAAVALQRSRSFDVTANPAAAR